MDNQYFTFENGIITIKIDSDMSNRTLSEIHTITDMLNDIMPNGCRVGLDGVNLYFFDGDDKYPINEHFDTTIY
jgi:hypothetical protein